MYFVLCHYVIYERKNRHVVHFSFCGEDMERFGSIPVAAHSVFSCFLWEQVLLAPALLKSVRSLLLGSWNSQSGWELSLISLLKSNISLSSHAKTDRLFHYFCPPLRFSVFPFSCYISIMSLNEPTSVWVEFSWEAQLPSQSCWLVWVQFCQVFHICFLPVAIFAKSSFFLIIQICLLHFSCQRQIKKN